MKPALVILSLSALVSGGMCKESARAPEGQGAETAATASKPSPWGSWTESSFPFFSSVLDARNLGEGFPKDNLTPRGIVLNLGNDLWACLDTDLLRIACIWQGVPGKPPLTQNALAPGSYHLAGQKTKDGQDDLPKVIGTPWMASGIYPGWQIGSKPRLADQREPAPSKEEVGRGALTSSEARLVSLSPGGSGVNLAIQVGAAQVTGSFQPSQENTPCMTVMWQVQSHDQPMVCVLGKLPQSPDLKPVDEEPGDFLEVHSADRVFSVAVDPLFGEPAVLCRMAEGVCYVRIPASGKPQGFRVTILNQETRSEPRVVATPTAKKPSEADSSGTAIRWPDKVVTSAQLGNDANAAYVMDDIPLPLRNPWKRNVRLADIAFLDDQGQAAGVTMDGDVWLISGLKGDLSHVLWKRFASGLHEPMSIVARHATGNPQAAPELFVYDRNGIWRLRDTHGRGEADKYEMFCNLFAQTAETREFPNSMKLAPDGSLIISKGGQEGTTLGKHNGTVIRVAPDGKSFEVIGWGLRQPFVGVNPQTGLITASDQEGNYVPTTPIHIIKDHQYYGFLSELQPHEVYPQTIADPVVWIPHSVNASGATQVWLANAKLGDLNDECIHVAYNRPELFRVLFNARFAKPQAAVVSFSRALDFAPLNAEVNPADGQLYVVGFQIWGTTAKRISGLARIRYTNHPRVLLKEVTPTDKGLLLRFNLPLEKALAADPTSYSIERWNYHRTFKYGSPQLKEDGKPGTDFMTPSSAYLSKDGLSVFVGIPDMKAGVMQMRIGWGLKGADGLPAHNSAYFTPYELAKFEPAKEGFGDFSVDLTPRKALATVQAKPTVEEGQRLYQMMGCMACHSTDGASEGKVGPSWKGLYGKERLLKDGKTRVTADDAYLKESMLDPSAKIVKGYEKLDAGMPIYAGVLNDSQIESLILFIKSLQ